MKPILYAFFLVFPLLVFSTSAQAYSCTVSSPGFATGYDPALATDTVVQSSATVSCSRVGTEAATMSFTLAANNGLSSGTTKATLGSQAITYDLFQASACSPSSAWKATGSNVFSLTLNFSGLLSASMNINYWACVKARQTGLAAGLYTDTITMTLSYGASQTDINTFPVSISTPFACNLSSAPGTVDFGVYVAYGTAVNASTSFGVTCTAYMPYTLAVSPTGGTIAGVAYTLAPSVSSNTGSGIQQMLSIDGTMAAGQSGICATGSCSGTNAHTLTVTY